MASLVALWSYISIAVILPLGAVALMSFQRYWSANLSTSLFTLQNIKAVFDDGSIMGAFRNSLVLALLSATVVIAVSTSSAYLITRNPRGRFSSFIDYGLMLPASVPNTILGLGFLLLFLALPLPLYGSLLAILATYCVLMLPYTSRIALASFQQIDPQLEEAASISGSGWTRMLRTVTVPLAWRGLLAGWTVAFVLALRELSASVMLTTAGTEVISTKMIAIWEQGVLPELAAIALLLVVATIVVVSISQLVAEKEAGSGQR